MQVSWQAPGDGGAGGEGASGSSVQSSFDTRSASAAGVRVTEDDPPEDDDPSDVPEASEPSYEVAWTLDGAEWSDGGSRRAPVTDTSATIEVLTNGQRYAFRVRVAQDE